MAKENLVAGETDAGNPALAKRIPAFWLQQAAELAIKAVLVAEDVDPPKHHDLTELRSACRSVEVRSLGTDNLAELNIWVLGARYPADLPDTPPDLERLATSARATVHAAELALSRTVGSEPDDG